MKLAERKGRMFKSRPRNHIFSSEAAHTVGQFLENFTIPLPELKSSAVILLDHSPLKSRSTAPPPGCFSAVDRPMMKVCRGAVKLPMPYPEFLYAHTDKHIRELTGPGRKELQETYQSVIDLDFPFAFDFLGGAHHSHVSRLVDRNNSAVKIDVLPGEPEGLRGSRYETAR